MRIRVIDAFTDRPFAGNSAGVCVLDTDSFPDAAWMQRVAEELKHAETAFAHPLPPGSEADYALRWFTPTVEVNLCGHATLATAHALHTDRGGPGTVRFSSRSGVLITHTRDDGTITLDFPTAEITEAPTPAGLAEVIGAKPEATFRTGTLRDLLAVFADEAEVRALSPDFLRLATLLPESGYRGLIATAPPGADAGHDFVSRFFAPSDGIPEDPVTGGAHTALAPYWSARLGRSELVGLQASQRTGLVATSLRGDRVHLTGRAVTVLDGTLFVTPEVSQVTAGT
jgi:PhzF family phenazine biosynthesis protein